MISFEGILARLDDGRILTVDHWSIEKTQTWAILGTNGSGKSALSCLFDGDLALSHGSSRGLPSNVMYVSLEAQAKQIEQERREDESDLLDRIDLGTPVRAFLEPISEVKHWISLLRIEHLLDQGFRSLSTGETRKVMLIRALQAKPDLLILDEPLEGLDQASRRVVSEGLAQLKHNGQAIIWVANRLDEIPDWITHIAFMHDAKLLVQGTKEDVIASPEVIGLLHFDQALPDFPPPPKGRKVLPNHQALVEMTDVSIVYGERVLFEGLNWCIKPGEHWAIEGPNGSGKTSLLQLITGDNPQCYRNQLMVFGMRRGSGETIWDIKQYIGLVSASLQWDYRASTNVLSTVISGLYDSIGLYRATGDVDKQLALQWLDVIGLRHRANQSLQHLSYGEQRLVLIARALIKQPALLILDEPCQGLDDPSRHLVLAFLQRLAVQRMITLLYVTHQPKEIPEAFVRRLEFDGNKTLRIRGDI
ncbi:MAG: molybdate transport system ATP-binding protein [Arenicella sp.]|jgi:molybdate transport system ATP-binding protein|nr:molybdate ABC transporter ATP-binding protein ModF [Thalassolituus oleivorans]APR68350.1 molybdate ABC transporter ATP-binding protein ModF [Thalassolituus oleivorans]